MPWKLIGILTVFGVFLAFITFNLENKSDINFGFTVLRDIPVFLTIFFSFSLGLVFGLPYIIRARFFGKPKGGKEKIMENEKLDEIERLPGGGSNEIH